MRPTRPPHDLPAEFGLADPATAAAAQPGGPVPTSPELVADSVISRPLAERMERAAGESIGIVVELRSAHPDGLPGAQAHAQELIGRIAGAAAPTWVVGTYLTTALTADQIRALVQADSANATGSSTAPGAGPAPRWAIHRIWPNFEIRALIHRSVVTTKCEAAHRAFNAEGKDITWAVLDSGIDASHPHFAHHGNLDLPDGVVHRSFLPGATDEQATVDDAGHGTHVAGILAGEQALADDDAPLVGATWYQDDRGDTRVERLELRTIRGMAPRCRLVSCKVLRDDGSGDIAAVLAALQYIQDLNNDGRDLRVHGVNLSVGYPFDPSWFSAGLTPVCREVDRLVRSGVLVVAAAGNTGYGFAQEGGGQRIRLGLDLTINDPGNADLAITVGSTSARPHLSGISYFSSKGPTGDGRLKPDLVAPGERVVSAGAGALLTKARQAVPEASYVENSGTSMAAPHVSGAAAAFLSVHREYLGRPEEVKRILLGSATDLGRSREFQGTGLIDVMRAIQSV
ncbi:MAG: S8 family peptidase [Micromonosporaceae bacterium]